MAVSKPRTESQEPFMIEITGNDGLVHHLGPFKSRAAAESWMAQNAPQCRDGQALASDNETRERKSGSSTI